MPLAGIASQASRLGYPVTDGGTVRVASTHVLASFPQSLFISVDTAPPPYGGGPPIFYSPYYSTDGGSSWHPVPIPPGCGFPRCLTGIGQDCLTVADRGRIRPWITSRRETSL